MTPLDDCRSITAADVIGQYRRHLSRGRASLAEMLGGHVEVASDGPFVVMSDGQRLLNFGGYGVFILGHAHPAVVEAVIAQLRSHPLSTRIMLEPRQAAAATALTEVCPVGLERVQFVNSGAEATEAAIKLARANGARHLISTHGGYHGKTLGALSATGNEIYQAPFRPLLPDTEQVPFGDTQALASALECAPRSCVILEPVQAEGGVVIPPDGYLNNVEHLCRAHGAFLVIDEIQTGMGRLGSWWGVDHDGITPDVMLVGKGLSGGVIPVAAIVATEQAFKPFDDDPFLHTSTFGGSPVAMAAAEAAIRALQNGHLIAAASQLGARILADARAAVEQYCPHLVKEVRGRGLLIGLEFHEPGAAADLMLELLGEGVITNHSLNAHRVLRLTPPAVLSEADLQHFQHAITTATQRLGARCTQRASA